jgi:hypothetical protein
VLFIQRHSLQRTHHVLFDAFLLHCASEITNRKERLFCSHQKRVQTGGLLCVRQRPGSEPTARRRRVRREKRKKREGKKAQKGRMGILFCLFCSSLARLRRYPAAVAGFAVCFAALACYIVFQLKLPSVTKPKQAGARCSPDSSHLSSLSRWRKREPPEKKSRLQVRRIVALHETCSSSFSFYHYHLYDCLSFFRSLVFLVFVLLIFIILMIISLSIIVFTLSFGSLCCFACFLAQCSPPLCRAQGEAGGAVRGAALPGRAAARPRQQRQSPRQPPPLCQNMESKPLSW